VDINLFLKKIVKELDLGNIIEEPLNVIKAVFNNELKMIVETSRIAERYTQRYLSKKIGLSQSTYNDTINGKIKKIDINILRKIAEELDLSLEDY
jgi:DNA-binding Xre family transcriptional regulator